ncbi:MAG: aspartate-semialdehyde dehydrogenase [Pirellulales bacterium]|nr:aspartate-semialdehyde dehydrogenase [Pirellulales bacterium]
MFDTIAIVGATGAVGRLIRDMLQQRKFPHRQIKFLASARSAGKSIEFAGRQYRVERLQPEAFQGVDLAIGSTPDPVAAEFVPWAVDRGCTVVDESGFWRMDPKVPLVVPEINPDAARHHQGILASPNCSTTQMVLAMKPLHDAGRIRRVVVSTYQATSGVGVGGPRDLEQGTRAALDGASYRYETFKHPIAFNLIPHIGSPKLAGYTSEEMKMVYETHKIFNDDTIRVCPTCVRVPVINCHSECILVETERKISPDQARQLFEATPGIRVIDNLDLGEYPMPITCDGDDFVSIGRIRTDLSCDHGLTFWCVSDNLRKGAATNAVQIAELLVQLQNE